MIAQISLYLFLSLSLSLSLSLLIRPYHPSQVFQTTSGIRTELM